MFALSAATLGLGAGTAMAGEVTGTGRSLQIAPHDLHSASECAFSGLNDEYVAGNHDVSRVQTFPQYSRDIEYVPPGTPGTACNPSGH